MSTFDYPRVLKRAQQRTKKFGRLITLVQLDSSSAVPAQPWKGNTDVRATPVASIQLYGVFVEPESLERLGKQRQSNDFVKSAEQVIIIAHGETLGQYDEAIDTDGSHWTIHNIQELAPGDSAVLHYFRAQRRGRATAVRGALL